jgi:hypothetical protein
LRCPGNIRLDKLCCLRGLPGKAVRLKERFTTTQADVDATKAAKVLRRAAKAEKKKAKAAAAAETKS